MTQQEQFETDYLAAYPHTYCALKRNEWGYVDMVVNQMNSVWLQQAKRHEAELSELRARAEARAVPYCYELTSNDPQADKYDHENRLMFIYDMREADGIEIDDYEVVPLYTAPPAQTVSANWEEAHRIIGRLMSSDPDFEDCTAAADFIRRLAADQSGPDGFATWKDAAIAERAKRVAAEKAQAVSVPDEAVRTRIHDALAEVLGDAYFCTRVWQAWSYGTMGHDDFVNIPEDGATMSELVSAVVEVLAAAPSPEQVEKPAAAGESES